MIGSKIAGIWFLLFNWIGFDSVLFGGLTTIHKEYVNTIRFMFLTFDVRLLTFVYENWGWIYFGWFCLTFPQIYIDVANLTWIFTLKNIKRKKQSVSFNIFNILIIHIIYPLFIQTNLIILIFYVFSFSISFWLFS